MTEKNWDISLRKQNQGFSTPFYYFRFFHPYISLFPSETRVGDVELGEDGNPRSTRVEYFLQRGQRGKKHDTSNSIIILNKHTFSLIVFISFLLSSASLKNRQSFICAPFFLFFYSIQSCSCNSIMKYHASKLFNFHL